MSSAASPNTSANPPVAPSAAGSASTSADYVARLAAGGTGDGPLARRAAWAVLVVALAAHLFFVTHNWREGFLIGHEFRQAQTALISDWVDRQDNFGLRYDTPIFGKPWAAPLEFPLYEWLVVLLKRATGWRDFEAARAISITAFYLLLPALWRLLGRAGLPRERRALALALLLSTPVYLFYSRAFLVEATVLCLAGWFLAAFVEAHATRRWSWAALAILAGAGAGLVKSLTWAAWVAPAGAYVLWLLWRRRNEPRAWAGILGWSAAMLVPAVVTTLAWTRFADGVKLENPAAHFITSRALSVGNYGVLDLGSRLAPGTWIEMAGAWRQAILPWWALLGCVAGGLVVAGRHRRAMLVALGLFLVPQLAIPYAYARQDYYFYACAVFLVVALGFAAAGLLEKPWPRAVRGALLVLPFAALWATYLGPGGYWQWHRIKSAGGSGVASALREFVPPAGVIVVAGQDWNATLPYYAQRRAFMVRNGVDRDQPLIERQLEALADESVSALVLAGYMRGNATFAHFIAAHTDIDPRPAFSSSWADVYLSRGIRAGAIQALATGFRKFHDVAPATGVDALPEDLPAVRELSADEAAREFPNVAPAPFRAAAKFGFTLSGTPAAPILGAHPEAKFWVRPPPGAQSIRCEFGIHGGGEQHENGHTDGVDFIVTAESPSGGRRVLLRRGAQPFERAEDRGVLTVEIPYRPRAGEVLVFETQRRATYSYDWAFWGRVEVR